MIIFLEILQKLLKLPIQLNLQTAAIILYISLGNNIVIHNIAFMYINLRNKVLFKYYLSHR